MADIGCGEPKEVAFIARMPVEAGTRAPADGDGAAANINRCIMEIYYGDELCCRMYSSVNDQKKASFSTQLFSDMTYRIVFWADHVADPATKAGLASDNYYDTDSADGLKTVSFRSAYVGNDDSRDAFFFCGDYEVGQGGTAFDVTLRRPFSQVNVITNDADIVRKSPGIKPVKVKLVLKQAMTSFNAMTGDAGAPADLSYVTDTYKSDYLSDEVTLSMDYLFASTAKELIDIDFMAGRGNFETGDNTFVSYSFTSVPYQRNYRTSIKGSLLKTESVWNVTIDPVLEGETDTFYPDN